MGSSTRVFPLAAAAFGTILSVLPGQGGRLVKVHVVKATDEIKRSQVQGEVLALESMRLVPRVSGYVAKIHVTEGAIVAAGAPLVSLESPELERDRQVDDIGWQLHGLSPQLLMDGVFMNERLWRLGRHVSPHARLNPGLT